MISLRGVWKRYGLPFPRLSRRARPPTMTSSTASPSAETRPWVLRDVSIEVERGEMLALLGKNGAAKSTLLRLIAGVTPPTAGEVEVHGRLFPLLELNAAIHPQLTGRENARLLGILAGLGRRVVAERMGAIEQFTDLGSWFERPVRTYSAGMCARL